MSIYKTVIRHLTLPMYKLQSAHLKFVKELCTILVHAAILLFLFQAILERLFAGLNAPAMYKHAVDKGLPLCMA